MRKLIVQGEGILLNISKILKPHFGILNPNDLAMNIAADQE